MKSLVLTTALAATVSATARSSPPDGAVTVCTSGDCDFRTPSITLFSSIVIHNEDTDASQIQDAVDATSSGSIFIYSGTYTEQVAIPESASGLAIYGETTDTSSYSGNVVSLEYNMSQASGANNNIATAALLNQGTDITVYNIDIKNTYGEGSQAVALAAYNQQQGYYGVGIYSSQDTLLAEQGTQIYANCYIEGATDFIFGMEGLVWITNSTIGVSGGGSITASGRDSEDSDSYYVITDSTVTTASGADVSKGDVYLGRPWREYARVAFQRTELPDLINSAGWRLWHDDDPRTDGVTLGEFDNSGDGASGERDYETPMSAALEISDILGSDYSDWVDAAYI
ncbi:hypothetical protein VMCG_10480 [Cytospora schulzeri]|uniref:Pectinesterase n=1 Tax=Cytospora schulzeri TaxID=448051 RepID=A0A423VBI3_9PEZI|nr:hypothetical protein VMCG_10480 [Valsa malicola]